MNHKNNGYWRGLVTGMMLGAGAAVLLTLKHEKEMSERDEGRPQLMSDSDDALSGTLDVAEDVANDLKTEARDVVESV